MVSLDESIYLDSGVGIGLYDDRIQEQARDQVSWTRRSSEQRHRWFPAGFDGGITACDTFVAGTV